MNKRLRLSLTRWLPFSFLIVFTAFSLNSCDKPDEFRYRTYLMGFQNSAPRYDDINLVLRCLKLWAEPGDAADAAIITTEPPWTELLTTKDIRPYIINNYKGLVDYYRLNKLKVWIYIDPTNGLNRAADAQQLVAAGKSISDPQVQALYAYFVRQMDSLLLPDHLGVALETNLIRLAATNTIYNGVKAAAKMAAERVSRQVPISISVQAEVAWGVLQKTNVYEGIAQDLKDFPFIKELGISSYPYFSFKDPADIPSDYYSKIMREAKLYVFVSEGGWPSKGFVDPGGQFILSDETKQAAYIARQGDLLNEALATAVFSLTFTDIDVTSLPNTVEPSINYFLTLGVIGTDLKSKPAFDAWKSNFKLPLQK